MPLSKDEYVEQAFFFKAFRERLLDGFSTQDILLGLQSELLNSTKLPLAVGFMLAEVRLSGTMSLAMGRLQHYFSPFQTYVMQEAEREEGRFDMLVALQILENEARYLSQDPTPQGVFFYQFETICRNRLGYDKGLDAVSRDPIFNEDWQYWINVVLRRQIGFVDIGKLVYVRSDYYEYREGEERQPRLFGEREGRIAKAAQGRDPLFFFSALTRHLKYPEVARSHRVEEREDPAVADLRRKMELLENRVQLLQEELKGGINLERFYVNKNN